MKVHFYGRLADSLGSDIEVDVPASCSIAEVRERLAIAHPEAAEALGSRRVRACVGDTIVTDSHMVGPNDSLDFLPPVSGG